MLTLKEQKLLENHLYKLIKESIFENGLDEFMTEKKHGKKKDRHNMALKPHDHNTNFNKKKHNHRGEVLSWLKKTAITDAEIMRNLWHPETQDEEDAERSLFSKKLHNKKNDNGSTYDFTDNEINRLYDLKGSMV